MTREDLLRKADELTGCPVVVLPTEILREWRFKMSLPAWALAVVFADRRYGWPRGRCLTAEEARLLSALSEEQFAAALAELLEAGLIQSDGLYYWTTGEEPVLGDADQEMPWRVDWSAISALAERVRRAKAELKREAMERKEAVDNG